MLLIQSNLKYEKYTSQIKENVVTSRLSGMKLVFGLRCYRMLMNILYMYNVSKEDNCKIKAAIRLRSRNEAKVI